MVEEVTIDDARDYVYTALRACERFADSLRKISDTLNSKQNEDEWLELVQTNCAKAVSFHEVQAHTWQQFSDKLDNYVEALKQEAEALAIAEIKGNTDGEEFQSLIHRREAKTLHPELHKFKLEKQAKILGMGGAPAVGSGMVLPKPGGKGTVLKATGSAAAREIYYSKVEEKDARYLADVMQFHTPKRDQPQQAEWQEEVAARHIAHRGSADKTPTPTITTPITPLTGELSDRLAARAAKLTEQEQADQAAERLKQASITAIQTTPELAAALKRRQSELAQVAATPSGSEPATPPTNWTNPATPYGTELSATLQRRAQHQAEATPQASGSNTPVNPLAGANNELLSKLERRQNALAGASALSQHESTPMPFNPAGMRTPMSDMVNSELAAKLRRRQQAEE